MCHNMMVNVKMQRNIIIYYFFINMFKFIENIPSNKMDIIYPATDKHILKFTSQPMYLVQETEEMYQTITLPYILDNCFSLKVCFLQNYYIYEKKKNYFFMFSGYTIA